MSGDVQAEWGVFKTAKKFNARSLPSAGENSYEQVYYRWVVERWEEWDTWQYFDSTKSFYNNLKKHKLLDTWCEDTRARCAFNSQELKTNDATKKVIMSMHMVMTEIVKVKQFMPENLFESFVFTCMRMCYPESTGCAQRGMTPVGYKWFIHNAQTKQLFQDSFQLHMSHSLLYKDASQYPIDPVSAQTAAAATKAAEAATDAASAASETAAEDATMGEVDAAPNAEEVVETARAAEDSAEDSEQDSRPPDDKKAKVAAESADQSGSAEPKAEAIGGAKGTGKSEAEPAATPKAKGKARAKGKAKGSHGGERKPKVQERMVLNTWDPTKGEWVATSWFHDTLVMYSSVLSKVPDHHWQSAPVMATLKTVTELIFGPVTFRSAEYKFWGPLRKIKKDYLALAHGVDAMVEDADKFASADKLSSTSSASGPTSGSSASSTSGSNPQKQIGADPADEAAASEADLHTQLKKPEFVINVRSFLENNSSTKQMETHSIYKALVEHVENKIRSGPIPPRTILESLYDVYRNALDQNTFATLLELPAYNTQHKKLPLACAGIIPSIKVLDFILKARAMHILRLFRSMQGSPVNPDIIKWVLTSSPALRLDAQTTDKEQWVTLWGWLLGALPDGCADLADEMHRRVDALTNYLHIADDDVLLGTELSDKEDSEVVARNDGDQVKDSDDETIGTETKRIAQPTMAVTRKAASPAATSVSLNHYLAMFDISWETPEGKVISVPGKVLDNCLDHVKGEISAMLRQFKTADIGYGSLSILNVKLDPTFSGGPKKNATVGHTHGKDDVSKSYWPIYLGSQKQVQ